MLLEGSGGSSRWWKHCKRAIRGKVLAVYPGPDKSYAMLTAKADMDDETLKRNLTYMAGGHR